MEEIENYKIFIKEGQTNDMPKDWYVIDKSLNDKDYSVSGPNCNGLTVQEIKEKSDLLTSSKEESIDTFIFAIKDKCKEQLIIPKEEKPLDVFHLSSLIIIGILSIMLIIGFSIRIKNHIGFKRYKKKY